MIVATLICVCDSPFGPVASSHVWSSCVAIDWPRIRLSFGSSR